MWTIRNEWMSSMSKSWKALHVIVFCFVKTVQLFRNRIPSEKALRGTKKKLILNISGAPKLCPKPLNIIEFFEVFHGINPYSTCYSFLPSVCFSDRMSTIYAGGFRIGLSNRLTKWLHFPDVNQGECCVKAVDQIVFRCRIGWPISSVIFRLL